VRCGNYFPVLKAPFPRYDATEAEEATSMTFIKPLKLFTVGATFVFLGAIIFGLL
jgi:hypothetical protein